MNLNYVIGTPFATQRSHDVLSRNEVDCPSRSEEIARLEARKIDRKYSTKAIECVDIESSNISPVSPRLRRSIN